MVKYKMSSQAALGNVQAALPGQDFVESGVRDEGGQLVGSVTIPHGYSSVTLNVTPIDDAEVEWDEAVELTLIDLAGPPASDWVQYYRDFPAYPTSPGDYSESGYIHYGIHSQDKSRARVMILDNDSVGGMVNRNVDVVSTGEDKLSLGNNLVNVDVQGGEVTLTAALQFDEFSPTYHGNDNLQPIISVETALPASSGVPEKIQAVLHFGTKADTWATADFVVDQSHTTAGDVMRLVVLGPLALKDLLRTGHYDSLTARTWQG